VHPLSPSAPALPLARHARAVLASTHHARVRQGTGKPQPAFLVDLEGTPLLACPPGVRWRGATEVHVPGWDAAIAGLVLRGRLNSALELENRRDRVAHVLSLHAPCLQRHLAAHRFRLLPLAVDSLVLCASTDSAAGSGAQSGSGAFDVDPELFTAADPDLFAVHGPALAAHLTGGHQSPLRSLAVTACGLEDPLAVVVDHVDAAGLGLHVLACAGQMPS
jgi:hypothetical protein